jgi:hypothetical protein
LIIFIFILFYFILFTFHLHLSIILQKEVFIWVDSELSEVYKIDNKLTWSDQKNDIITKLLPPLYKLVNKKYKNKVTNANLLDMLYGRWRSRHRVNNIEIQGDDQIKQNKRRVAKNTRMQTVSKRSINTKL